MGWCEDHVGGVAVLAGFAVDGAGDGEAFDGVNFIWSDNVGAGGCGVVPVFALEPFGGAALSVAD
ncbi:hypothetical protein GCM10007359_03660 [Rothia aerolata]|uniref:Uncharacterized protein n=1 Tax=Rothia aerolata TaxID=1812262 RepID=A0A917IPJ2_9MICC|nr:hypothetical protein GCM10007359_03660 [Rothia aerolata]